MFLYRYCIVCLQFFVKLAGDYIVNKRVFVNNFFVFVTSRDSWDNEGADADFCSWTERNYDVVKEKTRAAVCVQELNLTSRI